ncbi:MAG: T9SS type A sorting domain-containing protein [Bacteroidia bacterium]
MDKNLQKKLKSYSITAGTFTVAAAANAQINYTDIIPDQTVANYTSFLLYMDGDTTTDFVFYAKLYVDIITVSAVGYSVIEVPASNGVLGQMLPMTNIPLPWVLNAGDSIRPSSTFWNDGTVNYGEQYMAKVSLNNYTWGNWAGLNDMYLGVRFTAASQTHYGWIRCSVNTDGSVITLKDYAYNSTPGVGLTAGQSIAMNVAENASAQPQLHVYDRTLFVSLNAQSPVGGSVQISDITGRIVRTEMFTEPSMRFNLGDLSSGVYLVQYIQNDGTTITRKIYL